MACSNLALSEKLGFLNIYNQIKYMRNFYKSHPTYFRPDGLIIFEGPQGSGKSLSAVNYVYNLMQIYPRCKLVTNLELRDYSIINFEDFYEEFKLRKKISEELEEKEESVDLEKLKEKAYQAYLKENRVFPFLEAKDLTRYKNNLEGVIFLIDEIQLYFNSLGSKNIDIDVMTQISQQRKQRLHIVATSQVFGRMAKPLREQFDVVIHCEKKFFGFMQKNSMIDRSSISTESSTDTNLKGSVKKVYRYFKNPKSFDRYDTYKVIENKNIQIERKENDIYGNSRLSNNS